MKKISNFFFLMLLVLGTFKAQAEIQVQVSQSQINLGETFTLTLSQNNASQAASPDWSVVRKDFNILGSEQRASYSVINGQMQSSNEWVLSLEPKRAGILTIPAIKVGSELSAPISINVEKGSTSYQNSSNRPSQSEDVMIRTEVKEKKAYVNQQITYSVKLYNNKRLIDAQYQPPQVEDALIFPLGPGRRFQTLYNNKDYIVEEQQYAIFPQKSGPLKIISPKLIALAYDFDTKPIQAQDKPTILQIAPIPKNYKGKNWLPAKQILLKESYENHRQNLNQGSTLVRHIRLKAVAVPAQLLPPLHFENTEQYTVYMEKGKESNQITQGELVSSIPLKLTYLFKKAGQTRIPEVTLTWFNSETGKEETATLPPRSLDIQAKGLRSSSTPSLAMASVPNKNSKVNSAPLVLPTTTKYWPWTLVLIFGLAWLITLILWWRQRYSKARTKGRYKTALLDLQKACKANKPGKAKEALLQWASLHWPEASILNLSDLVLIAQDANLKKQVLILSQQIYGNQEKTHWSGEALLKSIEGVLRTKPAKKNRSQSLPPINPVCD